MERDVLIRELTAELHARNHGSASELDAIWIVDVVGRLGYTIVRAGESQELVDRIREQRQLGDNP